MLGSRRMPIHSRALGCDGAAGPHPGLAIVRQLVELHGGTVAARSDGAGTGATFIVELPIHQRTASEEAPLSAFSSSTTRRSLER